MLAPCAAGLPPPPARKPDEARTEEQEGGGFGDGTGIFHFSPNFIFERIVKILKSISCYEKSATRRDNVGLIPGSKVVLAKNGGPFTVFPPLLAAVAAFQDGVVRDMR